VFLAIDYSALPKDIAVLNKFSARTGVLRSADLMLFSYRAVAYGVTGVGAFLGVDK
jgi:hypothetical protein